MSSNSLPAAKRACRRHARPRRAPCGSPHPGRRGTTPPPNRRGGAAAHALLGHQPWDEAPGAGRCRAAKANTRGCARRCRKAPFPFPVKYGYSAVAERATGPDRGRWFSRCFPHQDRFRLPSDAMVPLAADLRPAARRAGRQHGNRAERGLGQRGPGGRPRRGHGRRRRGRAGGVPVRRHARKRGDPVRPEPGACAAGGSGSAAPSRGRRRCRARYDVIVNASAAARAWRKALDLAGPGPRWSRQAGTAPSLSRCRLGGGFTASACGCQLSGRGLPPSRLPRWGYRRRLAKALDLFATPAGRADLGERPSTRCRAITPRYLRTPTRCVTASLPEIRKGAACSLSRFAITS